MNDKITLFKAKNIITMCCSRPAATHVAVKDGRILGVGTEPELSHWGDYKVNRELENKILMPGFVEGHAHSLEGAFWKYIYVGYFDRVGPDGKRWKGLKSIDEVIARLQQFSASNSDNQQPVVGWGFDPIYFSTRRMQAQDLDQVSGEAPVMVMHASAHMLNANSFILDQAGITRDTDIHGIVKDQQGMPTGELQEIAAMFVAFEISGVHPFEEMGTLRGLDDFAAVSQKAGVTTVTDLYSSLAPNIVENMLKATNRQDFPVRIVPAYGALTASIEQGIELLQSLAPQSTAKLRFGLVKMMSDGSIQGYTARLKPPGYVNGADNGIWNAPPEQLRQQFEAYHQAGFQIHVHTNGDEASEVMLDIIADALAKHPRPGHRHTLQHCQLMTEAQLELASTLGVCTNMFANHIYYWGDEHYAKTVGPDRASRMEPLATAHRLGVRYAIHSDAPVTPISPLFTAWCAVNRQTASGRVLGEPEKLSVDQAMRAITLGAAYTLKMDQEVGSIEAGKFADFAVLENDPYSVPANEIKDIAVWGSVLGGTIFPA